MYKIFLTIALIAIFLFKQSHESKKYKVEFENKVKYINLSDFKKNYEKINK